MISMKKIISVLLFWFFMKPMYAQQTMPLYDGAVPNSKPYSTKELSHMYGVSDRVFRKWLKPFEEAIGKKTGHFYTNIQIEIIFEKLGYPNKTIEI